MLSYPAILTKDGDGYMVSFPDVPEAITGGATREEANEMAKDALVTALEFYFEDRRQIPLPSALLTEQVLIDLSPTISAKVLLLNEAVRQGLQQSDLEEILGLKRNLAYQLMSVQHHTGAEYVEQVTQILVDRVR